MAYFLQEYKKFLSNHNKGIKSLNTEHDKIIVHKPGKVKTATVSIGQLVNFQ